MKKLILFILILTSVQLNATTYYFSSSSGNDGNTGLTEGQAWQTITKLQGLLDTISAGTTVLLERGSVWDEATISIVSKTGTFDNRIVLDAYGTGDDPVIDLSKELGTWTNVVGNIWLTTETDVKEKKRYDSDGTFVNYYGPGGQMIINDEVFLNCREPNTGYVASTSNVTTLQTNVNTTWTSGAYNDGVAKVAKGQFTNFYQEAADINNNGATTLTLWNDNFWYGTVPPNYSTKFFLQNGYNMLDQEGEWRLNADTKQFYLYYTTDPNLRTIKYSVQDSGLYVASSAYVDIKNIEFRNGHKYNVYLKDNTGPIRTESINVINAGFFGLHARNNSDSLIHYQDTIQKVNNCGYWYDTQEEYLSIQNCYFREIGSDPVGINSRRETGGCGVAIEFSDIELVFKYNYLDVIGYDGLQMVENWTSGGISAREIAYNRIDSACLYISDGGGIYAIKDTIRGMDKLIHHNIITNTGGTNDYVANDVSHSAIGCAIYLDEGCRSWKVYDNYGDGQQYGTFFNGNLWDTVHNNVFRNMDFEAVQRFGMGAHSTTYLGISGFDQEYVQITGNYYVTTDTLSIGNHINDRSTGIDTHNSLTDSNHYINPYYPSEASALTNWPYFSDNFEYSPTFKTMPTIRSEYSWEVNSRMNDNNWAYSAVWGLGYSESMQGAYNYSPSNHYVQLLGCTIRDVRGVQHTDSVLLEPYTGDVFFYESGSTSNFLNIDFEYEGSGAAPIPPVATASSNSPVNVGEPLILTGGPDGMTSYSWSGPDSYTSSQQSPTVATVATVAMAGTYTLTVTDSESLTDDASTVVVIDADPTPSESQTIFIVGGKIVFHDKKLVKE